MGRRNKNRSRNNKNKAAAGAAAGPVPPTAAGTFPTLDKILAADSSEKAAAAATEFGAVVASKGIAGVAGAGAMLLSLLQAKKNPNAREGGLLATQELVSKAGLASVGIVMPLVGPVLELVADKKSERVREGAEATAEAILAVLPAAAVPTFVLSNLVSKTGALSTLAKWQTKCEGLELLAAAAAAAPKQIEAIMPAIVPVVSECMWDTKKEVKNQATRTMEACCKAIDNMDIEPFVPALIEAITHPDQVSECVYALAGTTFVQTVTAAALSITVPVLGRGFKEKKTAIQRKCAVITENMAKLVERAADVAPFMPILEPALKKGLENISDPEARGRFEKAHEVLTGVSTLGVEEAAKRNISPEVLAKKMVELGAKPVAGTIDFAASVAASMCSPQECFIADAWKLVVGPMIVPCCADKAAAEKIAAELAAFAAKTAGVEDEAEEHEDDDGEDASIPDLCDLRFSLAYGSNILLNNSRLHLKKGLKYGIIANKSAGKTTLLRAISNNQVEGFPTAAEMRAIFVENDIAGDQTKMNVVEFLQDTVGFDIKVSLEECKKILIEQGNFNDRMCAGLITQLSGGWKMKLALMRATMQNAQIMLMDEPTNHLDVINVQWVVDYLNSLPETTCLIVSHDTKFMDNVIDHVIHFDRLKLNTYRGNITDFVARFPEAKSYFELGNTKLKFKFPKPGPLQEGTRNRGRTLIEMKKVYFKYREDLPYQINDVSAKCSMASRVAIVGANGAGKSTMIKVLTGENKPTKGEVKMHPNCRFAYVAQHAFHHIEQHLEKSPNEYVCWRYQGGMDKESLVKSTIAMTEEEEKLLAKPWEVILKDKDTGKSIKEKRVVEKLMARRKERKVYVYEVKFEGKPMSANMWFPKDALEKKGSCFAKLVKQLDQRIAAQESMMARPLTEANVREHYANVGLDSEFSDHCRIKDLSGGQKVKVVLGACTWACPHLIILDEPTNYLDRDSLGALANALDDFEGGVVLITHNKEFADKTTRETWVVANNRMDVKGDPEWEKYAAEAVEEALEQETKDACGNIVKKKDKIPELEDMTRKEVKKYKKAIKAKVKRGEELELHEFIWADAWNIEVPE